ncbi:MAG: hypothetical protein AAGF71_10780 [Pseudomonadota bacterium]
MRIIGPEIQDNTSHRVERKSNLTALRIDDITVIGGFAFKLVKNRSADERRLQRLQKLSIGIQL